MNISFLGVKFAFFGDMARFDFEAVFVEESFGEEVFVVLDFVFMEVLVEPLH
jgi:hypothetical protein